MILMKTISVRDSTRINVDCFAGRMASMYSMKPKDIRMSQTNGSGISLRERLYVLILMFTKRKKQMRRRKDAALIIKKHMKRYSISEM